jgi:hypothetical protein
LWLKDILVQPPLRHDWFACLVYTKIAEWFGNSTEGRFGPASCWFVSLTEVENIQDPEFKGIFLTEKGSLGFLNQGQMARFYNGVAFIGPQESALEGIGVDLIAVGLDGMKRVVFILSDDYRAKFGLPKSTVTEELDRMRKSGVSIMSSSETLACPEPLDVVWTVPTQQADPNNPEALESIRPG